MADLKAEVKGNTLVLTIPFDKTGKISGSGKSMVHASTNGNFVTEVKVGEKALVVGLNAYTPVK